MPDPRSYQALEFTPAFLDSLTDLARDDQRRVIRALIQLDQNERVPALRVHKLQGTKEGIWSASASRNLRITFERLEDGHKLLLDCSHHYGD